MDTCMDKKMKMYFPKSYVHACVFAASCVCIHGREYDQAQGVWSGDFFFVPALQAFPAGTKLTVYRGLQICDFKKNFVK